MDYTGVTIDVLKEGVRGGCHTVIYPGHLRDFYVKIHICLTKTDIFWMFSERGRRTSLHNSCIVLDESCGKKERICRLYKLNLAHTRTADESTAISL